MNLDLQQQWHTVHNGNIHWRYYAEEDQVVGPLIWRSLDRVTLLEDFEMLLRVINDSMKLWQLNGPGNDFH